MTDKQLDTLLLFKADVNILYAIAETILNSMKQNNDPYNNKLYGTIDNYRTWPKPRIINWLTQFDLKLGDQIQQKTKNKVIVDIEKEKNEIAKEKNEIAQEKEKLENERQELEKLRKELEKNKEK